MSWKLKLLKVLGWLVLIFVVPNVVLYVTFWLCKKPASKTLPPQESSSAQPTHQTPEIGTNQTEQIQDTQRNQTRSLKSDSDRQQHVRHDHGDCQAVHRRTTADSNTATCSHTLAVDNPQDSESDNSDSCQPPCNLPSPPSKIWSRRSRQSDNYTANNNNHDDRVKISDNPPPPSLNRELADERIVVQSSFPRPRVKKPRLPNLATPDLQHNVNSAYQEYVPSSYHDHQLLAMHQANQSVILATTACGFIAQIRAQAHKGYLRHIDQLSFVELQYRRDILNGMLYFLRHDAQYVLDQFENDLLQERLETQLFMVLNWLKIRDQSEREEFQQFRQKVAQIRQRQRIRELDS
jgi:hypothetical protein